MRTLIQIASATGLESTESTPSGARRPLRIHVLATTEAGTDAALRKASMLASGFDSDIVVLVPHVVPYRQQLDHPAAPVSFTASRFRALAERAGISATVRVCVCRPERASLEPLLPREAIVLVGGRRPRWRRSPEERLVDALTRKGHRVLFVNSDPSRKPEAAQSVS